MDTNPKLSFVCPMKWDEMRGDERERFCEKCQRSVINISRMTKAQRTALLETAKTGRVCVAYSEKIRAATPVASAGRRGKFAATIALGFGAAAALVAAVVADIQRGPAREGPRSEARERMEYYYYTTRERIDEWVDDVRVFFGGVSRRRFMLGAVCTPGWTPPPPATSPTMPSTTTAPGDPHATTPPATQETSAPPEPHSH